jgi:hypothetical protein
MGSESFGEHSSSEMETANPEWDNTGSGEEARSQRKI